jgi:4-hydroxy-3-polyprenylbenzoate decarboxylase
MGYGGLRGFLAEVECLGQLQVARGAHWDLEIGAITELAYREPNGPAIVFDEVVGYPSGYRVIVNTIGSADRTALMLGLPLGSTLTELLPHWRAKARTLQPIPPRTVTTGPVFENVQRGADVDLLQFPTPRWHEHDGGRYIGTGVVVLLRDPDAGWVNMGTYRVMLRDRNHVSLYISPGKHGRMIRDKYFARGERIPVAISFGHDPLIFAAGSTEIPFGQCEYDWVGAVQGEPVAVIEGPVTGLPIPADAEIVIEGSLGPEDLAPEGPFGEWTGYYASGSRAEPVVTVDALYYRDQPILMGLHMAPPPGENILYRSVLRSALLLDQLERAGVPDVTGAWAHEIGGARFLLAVSIRQRYPGHARQAGHVAAMCHAGAYLGRYVVVVDEDIDVTDVNQVLWAMCTRADPEGSIDIIKRAWSGPLDPIIPPGQKGFNSRAIIDACRPYEWREQFPAVAQASPELRAQTLAKWGAVIRNERPAGVRG